MCRLLKFNSVKLYHVNNLTITVELCNTYAVYIMIIYMIIIILNNRDNF